MPAINEIHKKVFFLDVVTSLTLFPLKERLDSFDKKAVTFRLDAGLEVYKAFIDISRVYSIRLLEGALSAFFEIHLCAALIRYLLQEINVALAVARITL